MPKRTDISTILIIGAGPIVIGQACEFDYSGTQAVKALKEEGYRVVLVNSNPATIMTDPDLADATYIEPITPEIVGKIIEKERHVIPGGFALLPTMGGQTALNCALSLRRQGTLDKFDVEMIGATADAIDKAEDRGRFREAMTRIGLETPRSIQTKNLPDALRALDDIGLPAIIRPSFTMGGTGGGIAYTKAEFIEIVERGIDASPTDEVLIEESVLGWKEFETEVVRDKKDNCIIVCSIENLDPMGVHTGDSITVAPALTLTDKEYQVMRDASLAVLREIGVETGGSNVQFAINPENGRMIVIEMNPRVSRSSALASKATGFPIAKVAAKLAVGYTLDEIANDITRETPASFEPTIDYCVVKVPRFTFEKFPQADPTMTTQMKSVGEAMAIGRTFKEALQKALRSLEIKRFGLIGDGNENEVDAETLRLKLALPNAERIFYIGQAFENGMSVEEIFELTKIDRWFLRNVQQIVEEDSRLRLSGETAVTAVNQTDGQARGLSAVTGETPVFHGLDEHGDIKITRRHLPHWEQEGAAYFVTFRLADSIPTTLLAEWRDELQAWLKFHPWPWDHKTAEEYERRFVDGPEKWLDRGLGECHLRNQRLAVIVRDALRHFDRERYWLDAFVVMPNHVHVLVQPKSGYSLSKILHTWKSFSAHAINKALNREGEFWMEESHDRIVRDTESLGAYREYIAQNPSAAGLEEGEFLIEAAHVLNGREEERHPGSMSAMTAGTAVILRAKKLGFSDRQLAIAGGVPETAIRSQRIAQNVTPTYRLVDTCAAEFEAYTPYYYSTYGSENERRESGKRKIMILGGGPNRIGQGIEFDYCCVHAAFALRELGFETIMVNSNPETVSTDYDTSDKLYFEPLTLEDVLNIYDQENPEGVFVQFGGQTPLNLASGLKAAAVPILGTQPESIETAENRQLFAAMLDKLALRQTPNGSATSTKGAVAIAKKIGYPVLVRPSFVLGGRAMELVYNEPDLRRYMASAIEVTPDRPVLVDRFLEDAIEVDVDCIADGETTVIGAIMEHIEEAGIHSGDSACVIPTFSLSQKVLDEISAATKAMARALNVRGLMNVQFAVKGNDVYVLEVNPRASRTVPFVSKAIGVPLAKLAAKVMTGESLRELGFTKEIVPKHFSVKEAVFPFLRYQGMDISLGPEMKSTGEVMGMDIDLGLAYAKSQMAAPPPLPKTGKVFVSVKDADKEAVIPVAREFVKLGFEIISTSGTAEALAKAKIKVTKVFKIHEGRPNVLDRIKNGDINFIINTPSGKIPREHEVVIRNAALAAKIPIMTTVRAALASANGIRSLQKRKVQVRSLQEYNDSNR